MGGKQLWDEGFILWGLIQLRFTTKSTARDGKADAFSIMTCDGKATGQSSKTYNGID
jgi:hypothetical protein